MGLQRPNRPPPTDRPAPGRQSRRSRYPSVKDLLTNSQPIAIPLINGQAGQVIGRGVRNDLPNGGFDAPAAQPYYQPGDVPGGVPGDVSDQPPGPRRWGKRAGLSFNGRGDGGIVGWQVPYRWGGPLPWWVTRLLPLLLGAGVAGLLRQWPLMGALAALVGVALLHHYWIAVEVGSRAVRILYPAALIVACLAFASSPVWERGLRPIAATTIRVATDAIGRVRTPEPENATPVSNTRPDDADADAGQDPPGRRRARGDGQP